MRRHFRMETDFDTCRNFLLTFDEQNEQFLRVDQRLAIVKVIRPINAMCSLVHDFRQGDRVRGDENRLNTLVKWIQRVVVVSFRFVNAPQGVVVNEFVVRHSNPEMWKRRFGLSLSLESTKTKLVSQTMFLMSQNSARLRLTSCFIRRIRASWDRHFFLFESTMFSLFGERRGTCAGRSRVRSDHAFLRR